MTKTETVELTDEDCINILKWITAASISIEAKVRTGFSVSEQDTMNKINNVRARLRYA